MVVRRARAKLSASVLINLVFLITITSLMGSDARLTQKTPPRDVGCEAMSVRAVYHVGEELDINVQLVNRSDKPVYVVHILGDSDVRRRYPYAYFDVSTPPEGGWDRGMRLSCGAVNALHVQDFVELQPGARVSPFIGNDDIGFLRVWGTRFGVLKKPGRYTVTFHYVTDPGKPEQWILPTRPEGRPDIVAQLLSQVPKLDLACSVAITVEP